jgi:DNA polymerase (family X)
MRERDHDPAQPGKSAPRTDLGQRTSGPIPSALRLNHVTAERLREVAVLLAQQDDYPFRVAAYRRAADAVQSLERDIGEIVAAGGMAALEQIPGVGRGIAAALVEMLRTGRWSYLERLRGSSEPHDIFRVIPGIGPALAKRLHDDLEVETLEQLEVALYAPKQRKIKGIGPRRLAGLRASLDQALARIRPVRTGPAEEPGIDLLLDVDREYRSKAEIEVLRKIAPKRFNPKGEAWLAILHTGRGSWHFTALYSNTARAHELRKTNDWVVLYFHSDHGGEAQRTVVTETRGTLTGRRVVRGREAECLEFYNKAPALGADVGIRTWPPKTT